MYTIQCQECQRSFESIYLTEIHAGIRETRRFCSRHCAAVFHGRVRHESRLARIVPEDPKFYIKVLRPEHPRGIANGYVDEHILVAERALGRCLPETAEVHHVNRIRQDNSGSNLVICENKKFHRLLHAREDRLNDTGDLNLRRCSNCSVVQVLDNFNSDPNNWDGRCGICKSCRTIKRREYRASKLPTC
jgi:hypothetical protein